MQLIISPRATADIQDILQYTLDQWGETQQHTYASLLTQALHRLRDNPQLGHHRKDIHPAFLAYRAERHIIYYVIGEGAIRVARVLHGKMDPKRHLAREGEETERSEPEV